MRPRGDITAALVCAAARGPGAVRELAARAQVGYAVARYTASRMVTRGELVVVNDTRPQQLAVPGLPMAHGCAAADGQGVVAQALHSFFFVGQASRFAAADPD